MSGIIQGAVLFIDKSSLPTLARRMEREMPGESFVVSMSCKEGKVVVRLFDHFGDKAEFRRVVQSL
jgi:hypothetical protein